MKTLSINARPFVRLFVLASALVLCRCAHADVTRLAASPNPVRQGTAVTFSAYVNSGGRLDFFYLGRNIGLTRYPTAPGWVSVRYIVPNSVPAGYQCVDKAWSAQQNGYRVSATLRVCR